MRTRGEYSQKEVTEVVTEWLLVDLAIVQR